MQEAPMAVAKRLHEAMVAMFDKVLAGEQSTWIHLPAGERGEPHRRPYASSLGKCNAKARYERDGEEPTNPEALPENNDYLRKLFFKGNLMQGYVATALFLATDSTSRITLTEVRLPEEATVSGRIDVVECDMRRSAHKSTYQELHDHFERNPVIIEVKTTRTNEPTESWMYQVISYIEGLRECKYPIDAGYIITVHPDTIEHEVYIVERWADSYSVQRYVPEDDSRVAIATIPHEQYDTEVVIQAVALDERIEVLPPFDSPVNSWQCMKHTKEPHTYKRKYGDYQAGETRPGEAEINCPFFSKCWPTFSAENLQTTFDEHGEIVMLEDQEIPF